MAQLNNFGSQKPKEMPFDIGLPDEPEAPPAPTEGAIPGYMDPSKKCATCEYFDGDTQCRKYNAPADMDGNCPAWEQPEGEMEDESQAPAESGEIDRH